MKRVLFIFDRVAHYHKELFKSLDRQLAERDIELHLLSGQSSANAVGRVGMKESVVAHEYKYGFREYKLGTYIFRDQTGVLEKMVLPQIHCELSCDA